MFDFSLRKLPNGLSQFHRRKVFQVVLTSMGIKDDIYPEGKMNEEGSHSQMLYV